MRVIKRVLDSITGPLSSRLTTPNPIPVDVWIRSSSSSSSSPKSTTATTTCDPRRNSAASVHAQEAKGQVQAPGQPGISVMSVPSSQQASTSPIMSIGLPNPDAGAGVVVTARRTRRLSREDITHDMVTEWEAIQDDLKTKIIQEDTEEWQRDPELKNLKYIAGLDISYPVDPVPVPLPPNATTATEKESSAQDNSAAYVAIAVYSFPDMKLVYSDIQCLNLYVPYIPGFLAFRESKPLVDAVQNLIAKHPEWTPDVLLVDGNGILHPQQAGLASHVGYHTNLPCIGVSKNIFFFEGIEYRKNMGQNLHKAGDCIYLRDSNTSVHNGSDKILGMALKTTAEAKNPVYVSIGHRISLETARNVVLACCKYRIPEPIRAADHMSRELIRKHEDERAKNASTNTTNREQS